MTFLFLLFAESAAPSFGIYDIAKSLTIPGWGVIITLLIQSVYMIAVGIERWLTYNKAKAQSRQYAPKVAQALKNSNIDEAINISDKHKDSHLAMVVSSGLKEFAAHQGNTDISADEMEASKRALERAIAVKTAELKRGLAGLGVTKNAVKEMRLDRMTKLGSTDSDTGARVDPGAGRVVADGSTGGLSTGPGTAPTGGEGDEPPPPKATPKPAPKTVSGGVLNGKATSLPKPGYPAAARAVRASGSVSVQVLISESGSVISASAVSGHPLLRAAAESAARGARFSPTMLSGQAVKVSGVITYNFIP